MKIISIDASTEACSTALYTKDNIFLRHQVSPKQHSKLLLNMLDDLVKEAKTSLLEIDAFAYGNGPGSFTGLRIAASIAQGLAFAADKPIVTISTLQALAQLAWRRFGYSRVFAAIDARMHEVYFGFYALDKDDIMQNCTLDQISSPQLFTNLSADILTQTWYGVGSGVANYQELLARSLPCVEISEPILYPSALEISILASHKFIQCGGVPPEQALPVYLRNKVAEKQANLKQGKVIKK